MSASRALLGENGEAHYVGTDRRRRHAGGGVRARDPLPFPRPSSRGRNQTPPALPPQIVNLRPRARPSLFAKEGVSSGEQRGRVVADGEQRSARARDSA